MYRKSVALIVALACALGIAACSSSSAPAVETGGGGLASVDVDSGPPRLPPRGCPGVESKQPGASGLDTAEIELLPFLPTRALLCKYTGNRLTGTNADLTAGQLRRLRTAFNANGKANLHGVTSCPADFGGHVLGYFTFANESIEVYIGTSGCTLATNGSLRELFAFTGSTEQELGELIGAKFGR